MDHGLQRRRQAKAIAISETFDARRKRVFAVLMLGAAAMAVMFEALSVAQKLWATSSP